MPRQISVALKEHLNGEVLSLATIVRVVRRDGAELGFTSHSSDLTYEGLEYRANSTLNLSSLHSSENLGVDTAEAVGGLCDDRLTRADLLAGMYDRAEVWISVVNWADLSMGSLVLGKFEMGEISFRDDQFRVELRGQTQLLKQSTGIRTSPLCRCSRLGDSQCKVNLAPFSYQGVLEEVVDRRTVVVAGIGAASGTFSFGTLTIGGRSIDVKKSESLGSGRQRLTFRLGLGLGLAVGSAVTLVSGCDRTYEQCVAKFGNGMNFHGEPHLPGNDTVMKIGRSPA